MQCSSQDHAWLRFPGMQITTLSHSYALNERSSIALSVQLRFTFSEILYKQTANHLVHYDLHLVSMHSLKSLQRNPNF